MAAYVLQVNVSREGVPKRAVPEARVSLLGLEGDGHRDRVRHGGPERALCLFAAERIEALQAEGHQVEPGTLGENLTVAGLDWEQVTIGDRFQVGPGVVIQVTSFTAPCATVRGAFLAGAHSRISQKRHTGWSRVYARVLVLGEIRAGDPVVRLGGGATGGTATGAGSLDPGASGARP